MRKIFLYLYVLFVVPVHYTASSASDKTLLEDFAKSIKENNPWLYKEELNDIHDQDLVKSYSLISSDIPEGLVEGQPTTDHKIIARCYIDNDVTGCSLWQSLKGGKELFDKIVFSKTNNGNIDTIFENINNACKEKYNNECFTDEELSEYTEQQKKMLSYHIDKYIGLISEVKIPKLMKEEENSVFLFFDKPKSLEEEKTKEEKYKWEDEITFLLTTALKNAKYTKEENSPNGPRIAVYSKLPKLNDAKLLGSAILKADDYRLIAVRNYLGKYGVYLTDTVKILFLIEKSNNGKLMRFRISTMYPRDSIVNSRRRGWIDPFSNKIRMALTNSTTAGIVLDFLINYLVNYKDKGALFNQYLQDIPLEDSCSLDDLPRYLITSNIEYLWNLLDSAEIIRFDSIKNDINEYNKQYGQLEKDITSFTVESNTFDSPSSTLNIKKEALENIDLKCKNLKNHLDKLEAIQILINDLFKIDTIIGNKFHKSLSAVKSAYEIYFSQLDYYSTSIVSMINNAALLKDLLNNIKIPSVTSSLNNIGAENPSPPMPKTKSNKKKNKKNNKPGEGNKKDINKDYDCILYIETSKKELEELIQGYNKEYKILFNAIFEMETEVDDYSIMFTDGDKKQIAQWNDNIEQLDTQLFILKEKYKKLEDNFKDKKQIAEWNKNITQHDTQLSSLEKILKNNPTTIEGNLVELRRAVLRKSYQLKS